MREPVQAYLIVTFCLGQGEDDASRLTTADFDGLGLFDGIVDTQDGRVHSGVGRCVGYADYNGHLVAGMRLGWANGQVCDREDVIEALNEPVLIHPSCYFGESFRWHPT